MAARDLFHDAVKNALQKEGWTVTHDPLTIKVGGVGIEIDLGAEKLIAAEKGKEKIAIEIKSFVRPSNVSEFHATVGQYMNYRKALGKIEPDRLLYLAVPKETYSSFFSLPFISECIVDYKLKIIVYDPEKETVTEWKK